MMRYELKDFLSLRGQMCFISDVWMIQLSEWWLNCCCCCCCCECRSNEGGRQPECLSAVTGPNDNMSRPICLMAYSGLENKTSCQTVKTENSSFCTRGNSEIKLFLVPSRCPWGCWIKMYIRVCQLHISKDSVCNRYRKHPKTVLSELHSFYSTQINLSLWINTNRQDTELNHRCIICLKCYTLCSTWLRLDNNVRKATGFSWGLSKGTWEIPQYHLILSEWSFKPVTAYRPHLS